MPDLDAEKKRVDAKYKAAKAILGWLNDLPKEDAIAVLQHVGIDFKVVVTEVKAPDGK
jgi:hypothetical protein